MQIEVNRLVYKISKENNIPPSTVETIIRQPFKFAVDMIKEGKESLRLMYFGIFIPKKQVYNKHKNNK